MKKEYSVTGAVILLLGITWLLNTLNVLPGNTAAWLQTAIGVLGGAYLLFKE